MSYLVLARKWRPKNFEAVVGQEHVTRTLENAIELGRVAHALLFTGSRGIGKTSCARILAKALNCETGPTTTPCGVCSFCQEIENGSSVDVFEIDGASNNSVEQIREIRESVKFLPTAKGKRKMYIIDEVHMLSTSAFNALLKTLEEPPDHVVFVFATTEPHKIPDTILSRCQRYDFKRIPEKVIVKALADISVAENVSVDETALRHIAREAAGGMRDSLSLLDQVIAYCGTEISESRVREVLGIADRQILFKLVDALHGGHGQTVVELIDSLFQAGIDLQKFAGELVRHLRDLMVVKICPEPTRLLDLSDSEMAMMVEQGQRLMPAQIHRAFNLLLKCAEEVSRSPFPKLVLEMGLLQVCAQGPTLPVSEALNALAALEKKLAQGDPGTEPSTTFEVGVTPEPQTKGSQVGSGVNTADPSVMTNHTPRSASTTTPPWEEDQTHPLTKQGGPGIAPPTTDIPAAVNQPTPTHTPALVTASEPVSPEPVVPKKTPERQDAETHDKEMPKEAARPAKGSASADAKAKSFQKRPDAEIGEYDDFSAPPPSPRPASELPRLNLKARRQFTGGTHSGAAPNVPPPQGEKKAVQGLERSPRPTSVTPALEPKQGHEDDDGPPAQNEPSNEPDFETDVSPEADSISEIESSAPDTENAQNEFEKIDLGDGASEIEHFALLLRNMRRVDPFLASEFEQNSHLLNFKDGTLRLAIDKRDAETLERGQTLLEDILQQALGTDYLFEVNIVDTGHEALTGETLYDRKQRLQKEEIERRRELARTSSPVQMMVDTLKANIVDIRPQ